MAGAVAGAIVGAWSARDGSPGQVAKSALIGAIYGGVNPGSLLTKFVTGAVSNASGQHVTKGGNNCINFGEVLVAGVLSTISPAVTGKYGGDSAIVQTGLDVAAGVVSTGIETATGNPF